MPPVPFLLTGDPRTLPLEDPYAGAEVDVLTNVPLGVSLGIGRFVALFGQAVDQSRPDVQAKALRAAWTIFATDVGLSWNVYDRRGRVPLDEAFGRVPDALLVHALTLWADTIAPAADEPATELVNLNRKAV